MGVGGTDRDQLIRTIMEASGQITFFTGNDKEVRAWLLPRGSTALDAAGTIHTDLARGFIRAEVVSADDLIQAGSEREAKAKHLVRQEPKDYVVRDEDVLLIRFSV
jgi:ribosome-binding ATPase YchF (GTP1/OBG family)